MSKRPLAISFTGEIILGIPGLMSEVFIALSYLSASYLKNLNKVIKNGEIAQASRAISH
ncbi:hypothetical protein MNBD_GAMMA05-1738 [hydrothermal vent metagenome]|uniref:Uncharacterized protein n=1 Tax=hydrothermal vent metagenome TaxID=652676 RepID=A0A3B0WIP3_9ZZZZ